MTTSRRTSRAARHSGAVLLALVALAGCSADDDAEDGRTAAARTSSTSGVSAGTSPSTNPSSGPSASSDTTTAEGTTAPTTAARAAAAGTARLRATAVWGDPCPSDSVPPDPKCAPRPMEGVTIVVSRGGNEIERATTGSDGVASFSLPPGDYVVTGRPVDGYRVTPKPVEITLAGDEAEDVELRYESGRQ